MVTTTTIKLRIVFFAAFLLCAQWYFTMLSTQHALHNMTFKCPICATVNLFGASVISEARYTHPDAAFDIVATVVVGFYSFPFNHVYQSRAPPQV